MISLLILDVLIYNVTTYSTHLFLLGIPKLKSITILLMYFIILSYYDYHFLYNLILVVDIYFLNKFINNRIKLYVYTYLIEITIYSMIYLTRSFAFLSIL